MSGGNVSRLLDIGFESDLSRKWRGRRKWSFEGAIGGLETWEGVVGRGREGGARTQGHGVRAIWLLGMSAGRAEVGGVGVGASDCLMVSQPWRVGRRWGGQAPGEKPCFPRKYLCVLCLLIWEGGGKIGW